MGMIQRLVGDTLYNLSMMFGTQRDPVRGMRFVLTLLDRATLMMMYRGDWISRKVVNAPAEDATREWRSWAASKEQITKIEDTEKAFDLQAKTYRALVGARLFGGAGLVVGVDDGQTYDKPLNLDNVKEGSLKFIHAMNKHELVAGPLIRNPLSPWFWQPEYYSIASVGTPTNKGEPTDPNMKQGAQIHPSRVVRFLGAEIPDYSMMTDNWPGDSVLQAIDDVLRSTGLVTQGVAGLIADAKVDIISIPGMTSNSSDKTYAENLRSRMQIAAEIKSNLAVLVLDKEEEWERIKTDFANMPELIRMYLAVAAGASSIPLSRLVGQVPHGLANAGGGADTDVRNYFDGITSKQKTEIGPAFKTLDEVVLRSALGTAPDEITYAWNPLWQMDAAQASLVAYQDAQATQIYVNTGLINEDALREGVVNQLIENDIYPGFEKSIDEHGAEPDEPEVTGGFDPVTGAPIDPQTGLPMPKNASLPAPQKQLPPPAKKPVATDAAARTLYVYRKVLNADDIVAWAKDAGFSTTLQASDMHVTICYSKAPIDWTKTGQAWGGPNLDGTLTIPPGGMRMLDQFDQGAIVLLFNSGDITWRHCDLERAGASSKYPDYNPHVTITYNAGDFDWRDAQAYQGEIRLGPEVYQEITGFDPESVSEDSEYEMPSGVELTAQGKRKRKPRKR